MHPIIVMRKEENERNEGNRKAQGTEWIKSTGEETGRERVTAESESERRGAHTASFFSREP